MFYRWLIQGIGVALTLMLSLNVFGVGQTASAQSLSPTQAPRGNCLAQLPPGMRKGAIADWRDTVFVEHCDRIQRLWRISDMMSMDARPEFFDGVIEPWRLPQNIGVRMPLLRVVFPERVLFDTGSDALRPEAWRVVDIIAQNLRMEPPDVALFIAGHTDPRGGRDYNYGLSQRRAKAIAEAIVDSGVELASVWQVGFGEDFPIAAGTDDWSLGQNRRVEFLFAGRIEVIGRWMADIQKEGVLCNGDIEQQKVRCRASINPRDEYEVSEVKPVQRSVVRPNGSAGAAAPGAEDRAVTPGSSVTAVRPTSRRFSISPRNNRVGDIRGPSQ